MKMMKVFSLAVEYPANLPEHPHKSPKRDKSSSSSANFCRSWTTHVYSAGFNPQKPRHSTGNVGNMYSNSLKLQTRRRPTVKHPKQSNSTLYLLESGGMERCRSLVALLWNFGSCGTWCYVHLLSSVAPTEHHSFNNKMWEEKCNKIQTI